MKYYYNIYLNFYDYLISYYEWNKDDNIEFFYKLPIYKVSDIKRIISEKAKINIDEKNAIISDGINSIAIEVLDKDIVYLSSISYSDEEKISGIALDIFDSDIEINYYGNRENKNDLRSNYLIKKILINKINENNKYFLKYLYYNITNMDSDNLNYIKDYLIEDINNNFNDKYRNIYDIIFN